MNGKGKNTRITFRQNIKINFPFCKSSYRRDHFTMREEWEIKIMRIKY